MSAKVNLEIEQGVAFDQRFILNDQIGSPTLFGGYTAVLQIRSIYGDLILELSTANGRIVLSAEPGSIDLTLSAGETGALDFTNAVYDLVLTSGGGIPYRIMSGMVNLSPSQTKLAI